MNVPDPEPREPSPGDPKNRDDRTEYGGLLGIALALIIVVGAIYMIERMRHYAALGDCAFTHAPQCAELVNR